MENIDYRMPLYILLQDVLIKRIEEGEFLPGEMIPSERKMAEQYGINRMTVKNAVNSLVERGYLFRVQGKGTFVVKKDTMKLDLGFVNESGNSGITAMLKGSGKKVSNVVLAEGLISNKYLADKLSLADEEEIYGLHRIRKGNDVPIAVEYTYVPKKYFEDIEQVNFLDVSLYDYMDSKGHMPEHFIQNLIVLECGEREAALMGINKGQEVYYFEYISADRNYNIVEYTENYMDPEKVEFRYNIFL